MYNKLARVPSLYHTPQHLSQTIRTMATQHIPIKVEMTSDAICMFPMSLHVTVAETLSSVVTILPGPFCFIGYQNLNKAISLAQSKSLPIDVSLQFKPFLLDPTLTSEPMVKRERYAQKFGPERVKGMEAQMIERGKAAGINLYVLASIATE